jgi:bacterioferritin-associated ferredoxin
MKTTTASDEVTNAIAHIETQRQDLEKQSGRVAACAEALRQLQELLEREKAAPEPHGAGSGYLANMEIVMIEIKRIKKLASVKVQADIAKNPGPHHHQMSLHQEMRNPARSKGRRTMGRRGEG